MNRKIAIVIGSDSDFETMKPIIPMLRENGVDYDFRVISAHRTPWIAAEFAKNAKADGYDLMIVGAGMSAHLPGVLAAFTGLPVIGVPIKSDASGMDGMDALHSIIQMPPGVPVAAVGIDNATGAAKLAVKMLNFRQNIDWRNGATPIAKIVYHQEQTGAVNLEKVKTALTLYGIGHTVVEFTDAAPDMDTVIKALTIGEDDHTAAILNLTDIDIEKIIRNEACADRIPVIAVPLKALTSQFNDTSNQVYSRMQAAESVAFVGVNAYPNAAHLLARIVGIHNRKAYDMVIEEHAKMAAAVIEKDAKIRGMVDDGKHMDD